MQFILDDEIRRQKLIRIEEFPSDARFRCTVKAHAFITTIHMTEESARLSDPWQACKLVDRRD